MIQKSEILDVLIVDDEISIANLLKNSIDWAKMGMVADRIALSAGEALEMINDHCPDIIFTDIQMPAINGLAFAKQVNTDHPTVKIVVLTGFDDFKYAKEAVSLGILEYIQKPIDPQAIERAALKAKTLILDERKALYDYDHIRSEMKRNFGVLRENFLNTLVMGNIHNEQFERTMQYYDISPKDNQLSVAILKITTSSMEDEELRLLPYYHALKQLRDRYEQKDMLYIFQDPYQRIVILSFSSEMHLSELCAQLSNFLLQEFDYNTNIGIGSVYTFQQEYRLSYQEASSALKFAVANGENQIIESHDLHFSQNVLASFQIEDIENLIFFVRTGTEKQVDHFLEKLKADIRESNSPVNTVRIIVLGIVSGVTQAVILSGLKGLDAFTTQSTLMSEIYSSDDVDYILQIVTAFIQRTTRQIDGIRMKSDNQIIAKIKEYLTENIQDPHISLSKVSVLVSHNQNYLSRLFKQQTGKTFSDYLMSLRMNKAIQLVINSDLRSYQIAEQVGFEDPNYFSLCFKRYTSKNVSEYRVNSSRTDNG